MKRLGTVKWKFGNSLPFQVRDPVRFKLKHIDVQLMRFSLPYSSDAMSDLGGKDHEPETSLHSVHAWFHFTLITNNLQHRNSICRWTESSYVNVSQCVVKVLAALPKYLHRNLTSSAASRVEITFTMEISLSSSAVTFHYNFFSLHQFQMQ